MVAPMSGTVYRKPAPGEPLFVKEGDKVTVGQTICIIEVQPFHLRHQCLSASCTYMRLCGHTDWPTQPS